MIFYDHRYPRQTLSEEANNIMNLRPLGPEGATDAIHSHGVHSQHGYPRFELGTASHLLAVN
jgi:hypothetical protein